MARIFRAVMISNIIVISMVSYSCIASEIGFPTLNLGNKNTPQVITRQEIACGLTFYNVKIDSNKSTYALISSIVSKNEAELIINKIKRKLGLDANLVLDGLTVSAIKNTTELDTKLAYRVIWNNFTTKEQSSLVKNDLLELGIKLSVIESSLLANTAGNFDISILKIEPTIFKGSVKSILANDTIQGLEKISQIASRANAVAAINGGFFVYKNNQGTPGDPAGISVINGKLVSEAIDKRPALLIRNSPKIQFQILQELVTQIQITIGTDTYPIDGINRSIGSVFNCGYIDGLSVVPASHDVVCRKNDEIIIYDSAYGEIPSETFDDNLTFLLDSNGNIAWENSRSSPYLVLPGQVLIVVSGKKKTQFNSYKKQHLHAAIETSIYDSGKRIYLKSGDYIINGGPTLLAGGMTNVEKWASQGWDAGAAKSIDDSLDDRDANLHTSSTDNLTRAQFFDSWVNQRHPRTAAGVDEKGTLYVTVVYGREPERSAGASILEMANIMQSLGVTEAVNLDGGGSSSMYVDGTITGKPSDELGEREVADSLVFIIDSEE